MGEGGGPSFPCIMENRLLLREWVSISVLLGLIICLTAIAASSRESKGKIHRTEIEAKKALKIAIEIKGAVKNPGIYYFSPGITLKEVFKEVQLDKTADRKQIDVKKVLYSSQVVEVPFRAPRTRRE
jgi:hypothetical protein